MHLNQVPFQILAVLNIIYCNLHSFWYLLLTFLDFLCFILGFSFGIYDDKTQELLEPFHLSYNKAKTQVTSALDINTTWATDTQQLVRVSNWNQQLVLNNLVAPCTPARMCM